MHVDAHLTHTSEIHSHKHHHRTKIKWLFFTNALTGFVTFLVREMRVWRIICYVLFAIIPYFKKFIMSFDVVQKGVRIVEGPIIIYLFGTYLTSLPYFVVIPLMFFPLNKVMPALAVIMCFNFVRLFAI